MVDAAQLLNALPPHERYDAGDYASVAEVVSAVGATLAALSPAARDVILTALQRCARLGVRIQASATEPDAFFRVYGWEAGRILDAGDIADVQKVLRDFNDEIGANDDRLATCRAEVLHEIGGPALVAACDAEDRAVADRIPVLTNTGRDPAIRRGRIGEIKLACPRCGSFHLTAYNLEVDGDTIRAEVLVCHECKGTVSSFTAGGRQQSEADAQ